ncbi:hypothetical protein [Phytohabitans kaempferiae]|uniref:Uncharacterized protein n=1 Tax=Phytohabitans kaempferiae TaxID=1620943 RepID=A0ABV6LUQ6_9ACTN
MRCYHCGAGNVANYLVCVSCQRPRVIGPPPTVGAVAAPAQVTPTVIPAAPPPTPAMPISVPPLPTPQVVVSPRPAPPVIIPPGAAAPGASPQGGLLGGGRFARDSTRYLCAAAQTDSTYGKALIEHVVEDRVRAVASSPGIDLVTVLKYALAARRRHIIRDVLLVLTAPLAIILLILPAWAIVFGEQLVAQYGVVARRLRRHVFDPAHAPEPTRVRHQRRLAEIATHDRGNATVFPAYAPFVGFGPVVEAWSFALDLKHAAPDRTLVPFSVHDLYDHMAAGLSAIDLPGVSVEERVFAGGMDLQDGGDPRAEAELLPVPTDGPLPTASPGLVRHLREKTGGRNRSYLAVRVPGWSGELVVTIFLRFAHMPRQGALYVEASHCLLTPVKARYREVDRLRDRPTMRQLGRLALVSLVWAIPRLLQAFGNIAGLVSGPWADWLRRHADRRAIVQERSFNFGPVVSPRELASDQRFARYFQELDKEMYDKLIERQVLDLLTDFLERHGVDTTELSRRQNMILNHGVIVTGQGTLNAGSIAAGQGAVARTVNAAARTFSGGRGSGK